MGSGIAEAAARAGLEVAVVELDGVALDGGRDRVAESIARGQSAKKLTEPDARAAFDRIEFSTDIGSLSDRQLVVEAVMESEPENVAIFEMLDKVVEASDGVLASNTAVGPAPPPQESPIPRTSSVGGP
jgi:3-hydroxybutyryl-CoA dehydrogenase